MAAPLDGMGCHAHDGRSASRQKRSQVVMRVRAAHENAPHAAAGGTGLLALLQTPALPRPPCSAACRRAPLRQRAAAAVARRAALRAAPRRKRP
jgi:hypothetical protein